MGEPSGESVLLPADQVVSAPPVAPPPVFYKIDSTRVSMREYWWGTRNPLVVLLAWLLKLLRMQVPSSADDPSIDVLHSFEVDCAELPDEVRQRLAPVVAELEALGFSSPIYHAIDDAGHLTHHYLATMVHASAQALARIHHRVWHIRQPAKSTVFCEYISELAVLWESHLKKLTGTTKAAIPVRDQEDASH